MKEWQIGDRCQITDMTSLYYLKTGTMSRRGEKGWYIKIDGVEKEMFFPWGHDIIRNPDKK